MSLRAVSRWVEGGRPLLSRHLSSDGPTGMIGLRSAPRDYYSNWCRNGNGRNQSRTTSNVRIVPTLRFTIRTGGNGKKQKPFFGTIHPTQHSMDDVGMRWIHDGGTAQKNLSHGDKLRATNARKLTTTSGGIEEERTINRPTRWPRSNIPTILGIPYDASSSHLRGPSLAPSAIRQVLHSTSGNWSTERGVDLNPELGNWHDAGDVEFPPDIMDCTLPEEEKKNGGVVRTANVLLQGEELHRVATGATEAIKSAVKPLTDEVMPVVSVGGDHFVTYPLVDQLLQSRLHRLNRGEEDRTGLTILHIDAHSDLYDDLDGDMLTHASPMARILDRYHPEGQVHLVQVGIRTMTCHQRSQAERFGVDVHEAASMAQGTSGGRLWLLPDEFFLGVSGRRHDLYLSIDVDALDPAFAPGVSHHEPGGLDTRQVLGIIHQVGDAAKRFDGDRDGFRLVGADVVEVNPLRDVQGMTAAVGSKLVKEILGILVEQQDG